MKEKDKLIKQKAETINKFKLGGSVVIAISAICGITAIASCAGKNNSTTNNNSTTQLIDDYSKYLNEIEINTSKNTNLKKFKYLGYELVPVDNLNLEIENYKQPYYIGIIGDALYEDKNNCYVNYYRVSSMTYRNLINYYKKCLENDFYNERKVVTKEYFDKLQNLNDTTYTLKTLSKISNTKPKWTTNYSLELKTELNKNKAIQYTVKDLNIKNKQINFIANCKTLNLKNDINYKTIKCNNSIITNTCENNEELINQ